MFRNNQARTVAHMSWLLVVSTTICGYGREEGGGGKQKEPNFIDFIEICNIYESGCSVLNVLQCICLLQN